MSNIEDRKFTEEAIKLLDNALRDCTLDLPGNIQFSQDELLKMYRESQFVLQCNPEDEKILNYAESVFYTCIRIVCCACMSDPQSKIMTIGGKEQSPSLSMLIKNARKKFTGLQEGG